MEITGQTLVYGIIGNPVRHSLSPVMHNAAFAALHEDRVYIPLPADDLAAAVAALRHLGVAGASVTIPFKEAVLDLVDEIDPLAARIGAVNTIQVRVSATGRRLYGCNTDWLGSNRALAEEIPLAGSTAVILGAGGAAKAVAFGLIEAGADVIIHSRSAEKGRALARLLDCAWFPLDETGQQKADILINATSVGMTPNVSVIPVDPAVLPAFQVVMDAVYAPLQTRLLREAAAAGCRCVDGLQMLLYQGVAQFELWTGREAPLAVMRQALLHQSATVAP